MPKPRHLEGQGTQSWCIGVIEAQVQLKWSWVCCQCKSKRLSGVDATALVETCLTEIQETCHPNRKDRKDHNSRHPQFARKPQDPTLFHAPWTTLEYSPDNRSGHPPWRQDPANSKMTLRVSHHASNHSWQKGGEWVEACGKVCVIDFANVTSGDKLLENLPANNAL